MQKWEYTYIETNIFREKTKEEKGRSKVDEYCVDPTVIWKEKNKNGETTHDLIKKFGKEGWELISVTPINEHLNRESYTTRLFFTFKRQLCED